jgi:spermidine synthase
MSFYENGLLVFSFPDVFSAEEGVQFALLEHPDPDRVLLIGGGVGDCLSEILKHGVSRVDYVELDPRMVQVARRFLPITAVLDDPRVNVVHTDGRFFVKVTENRYDCVILNLPDPFTTQLNRFYTLQFFEEVSRILRTEGVFSFRVTSAENYIGQELGQFLSSLSATLDRVFEETVVIPGESNIFVATHSSDLLTLDPTILIERLKERSIDVKYMREYYLPYRMSPERAEYLRERIEETEGRVNRDFQPVSYYYNIVLWSTHFHTGVRRLLASFSSIGLLHILLIVIGFAVLTLALSRRYRSLPILVAVGTTGSAEIIMEVVCLLAFQVLYGFVYSKMGVITAAFMIGLTSGSVLMVRVLKKRKLELPHFGLVQIAVCVYPLALITGFRLFSGSFGSSTLLAIEFLFPLLTFLAGFIGGLQFPLANSLYLRTEREVGRVAGVVYGVDLFGACIGAGLASAILIPILGIFKTCYIVVMFNLVSVLVIGLSWRRQSRTGESG